MRPAATILIAFAATTLATVPALFAASGAPQQVGAAPANTARAMSGTSASVAAGDTTVIAWLQDAAGEKQVMGSTGTSAASVRLGPDGAGSDGAPASVAGSDGSVWVVASRGAAGAQRLWMQRWADGKWQPANAGPLARSLDHHPALATGTGGDELWATWLGEDADDHNAAMLYASRWTGSRWTPAETLPRTVGVPMAPSMTIDAAGTPIVAWAAGDGNDAEIWVSARQGGRWSSPRPLTRNQVPDITPSITRTPRGLLATWITYTDEGYLPVASTADAPDAWGAATLLSDLPGSHPRALTIDGNPAILWRHLELLPAGGTITARVLSGEQWNAPVRLASASGSPFGVTSASDGRLVLAFSRPDGRLGVVEGDPARGDRLDALAAASAMRFGAVINAADATPAPAADAFPAAPENYSAFGDSITNGVVYDPDRNDSAGYRGPLQDMLRGLFRVGDVLNAGVDGEMTVDGLARIGSAVRSQGANVVLIMEGTNDIVNNIDVDTVSVNLRRMVQRSFEESPSIVPLLAQIPPEIVAGTTDFDGGHNFRIDELNALLPDIAAQEGAILVDQNTPLDGHPEYMSDHLHPSAAGYQVMAEQWFDAIKPIVLARTNRGDVDGSGRTDGLDLVYLSLAFGAIVGEERYTVDADINGDGIVDGFDLDLLIEFFGQDVSGTTDDGS